MTVPSPATERARDALAAAGVLGRLPTDDASLGKPAAGMSGGTVRWAMPVPVVRGPVADRGAPGAARESRSSGGRNVAPTGSFDQSFAGCEDEFPGNQPPVLTAKLLVKAHDICNDNYAVKYSGLSRTPMVSSEHITKQSIEQAANTGDRSNDFRPDPRLSASERSELADYKGYIYVDRGHMSPHGDMPTKVAGSQSFFLSNMVPQAACHNEGLLERIESGVRAATGAGDANDSGRDVYVATGPAFIGENVESLNGRVLVPTHIWKAVYIPEKGTVGVYWTPNRNAKAPNDTQPDVETISINELKKRTGIDVFPSITDPRMRNMAQVPPIAAQARFGCRVHEHDAGVVNDLTKTKG